MPAAHVSPLLPESLIDAPITLPPYLIGERVQLLIMSARSTRLADADVLAVAKVGQHWNISVALLTERATFALTATATTSELTPPHPIDRPCAGCNAEAGEPCRIGCLSDAPHAERDR